MTSHYTLLALALLFGMLAALEIGRRLGQAHHRADKASSGVSLGAVEGAVFALLGLLLAFTFSSAASRFEHRRDLVVQEANAIGTAYLRLDLLDRSAQDQLRPLFREYVASRLASYRVIDQGKEAFQVGYARSVEIQSQIWKRAVAATERQSSPAVMTLVLAPINDMIDITTTRVAALRTHPPLIIFILLGVFAITGALIAGYGMSMARRRYWLHMLLFAIGIAGTVYVIIDLEYPRRGLIRVDSIDEHLEDVLVSMQPAPQTDLKK